MNASIHPGVFDDFTSLTILLIECEEWNSLISPIYEGDIVLLT